MAVDSKNMEKVAHAIEGAVRDSFMDYGGAPNVVDGLNNIANAIHQLAEAEFEIARAIRLSKQSDT